MRQKRSMSRKLYLVYILTEFLGLNSTIGENIFDLNTWDDDVDDYNDVETMLFAVTDNETLLEGFFIVHDRDMFIVKESTAHDAVENDIEPETYFSQFWLSYRELTTGFWSEGSLKITHIPCAITSHEDDTITNQLEFSDEYISYVYDHLKTIRKITSEYLSEDMLEVFKTLNSDRLLNLIGELYGSIFYEPDNHPDDDLEFIVNEWGLLNEYYHEVLIGGDIDGANIYF